MNNYKRSICSTCSYAPDCSLTTNMSNISSCSEYVHCLEKYNDPLVHLSQEDDHRSSKKEDRKSLSKVRNTSKTGKVAMRTAAFIIANERLEKDYVQRGIFP